MKTLDTGGITFLAPVPGGTGEWYYGMDGTRGDLYEAEELFRAGQKVRGGRLLLVRFPEGTVYEPLPPEAGVCPSAPVYLEGGVYFLRVDFPGGSMEILRFDGAARAPAVTAALPLAAARDCYNLGLDVAPLTLRRQGGADGLFEILWPERVSFPLGARESFFLRDGDRLFFSRWHEEGEGADYRYWEETVIRDQTGAVTEVLPGDVLRMPDGELWHLR